MPRISTHMHFGKLLLESSDDDVDIHSFILGMTAPDAFTDDKTFEQYHYVDEDGDISVRDFYESFDWSKFNLKQKSFVLGYYGHLWFDEYYKFNASKLTVHNNNDLSNEELGHAIKNLLLYYDNKVIDGFYDKIKEDFKNCNLKLQIEKLDKINLNKANKLVIDFFNMKTSDRIDTKLIIEEEYLKFIYKSVNKFLNSLN